MQVVNAPKLLGDDLYERIRATRKERQSIQAKLLTYRKRELKSGKPIQKTITTQSLQTTLNELTNTIATLKLEIKEIEFDRQRQQRSKTHREFTKSRDKTE